MNYGKVEERSSSRSRSPSTARRAATSAILMDILSRSDRAPTSRTADALPGWDADLGLQWMSVLMLAKLCSRTRSGHADSGHRTAGLGIRLHSRSPNSEVLVWA